SGHHGDARGKGAHPECDTVGAAVLDPHAPVVDAERIRADLRHHGLDALAEGCRTGHDLDETRRTNVHPHAVERTEAALLDEEAEARPDAFSAGTPAPKIVLQRIPFEGCQRLIDQAGVVA